MKKFTLYIMTVSFILMATCPINYADENKTATQSKKGQSMVNADSDQYIIGPEDVLLIYVWKEESITRTVPVRIDGKISLPLIDDIQAAGLTPLALKKALMEKLKGFVDNPTVTVTVMEANSYKAYVSGEVRSPGVFRFRDEMTLIKLIIAVGGFTEWANQKKILIITKEKGVEKRITANYKKIIEGDEPDIIINRGDTVIIK
jgi:polysaccharide export outer membrane protein